MDHSKDEKNLDASKATPIKLEPTSNDEEKDAKHAMVTKDPGLNDDPSWVNHLEDAEPLDGDDYDSDDSEDESRPMKQWFEYIVNTVESRATDNCKPMARGRSMRKRSTSRKSKCGAGMKRARSKSGGRSPSRKRARACSPKMMKGKAFKEYLKRQLLEQGMTRKDVKNNAIDEWRNMTPAQRKYYGPKKRAKRRLSCGP